MIDSGSKLAVQAGSKNVSTATSGNASAAMREPVSASCARVGSPVAAYARKATMPVRPVRRMLMSGHILT